ncbi:hypothetical protein ACLB2K_033160 [Fragaria x ananassa]
MLEKIGLPPKPSLRGNNWVVDASHCQGCSSQFTFINRKHHCRRCGGIFCGSCTQQRMFLRGQGDSPVLICEPCKKLEEAARFERYGHKSRAARGSSMLTSKPEDEILNQILGNEGKESGQEVNNNVVSSMQRASSASCSSSREDSSHDAVGEILRSVSVDKFSHLQNDSESATPEELRQQALDEKKKYKILKGEGKSAEALRAFKKGKELERQADALEISLRKRRKKDLLSDNVAEGQIKDDPSQSGRRNRVTHPVVSQKNNKSTATSAIDKTQVVAHKKKALQLKREGKLAEAKEELKRAKVLEKQLEEYEFLAEAEESDDEISALIRSMDDDKEGFSIQYEQEDGFNFDSLINVADDHVIDSNFEVTDEDMEDPEITAALKSLGWTQDSNNPPETSAPQIALVDKEALLTEIQSLKREALTHKRAGNVTEAMTQLKKAKLLERDLENIESQKGNVVKPSATVHNQTIDRSSKLLGDGNFSAMEHIDVKPARKSKLMIQKELLALKKKARALRQEGRLDAAEEEMKKGRILEHQLEEMENGKNSVLEHQHANVSGSLSVADEEGDNVTDQDMYDPAYLSMLKNLGWNDDNEVANSSSKPYKQIVNMQATESSAAQVPSTLLLGGSRKSKSEIQKELLGLKRKALALRRQGDTDEAEEVLKKAKALEEEKGDVGDVTENDMQDPALLSVLKSFGWDFEEHSVDASPPQSSSTLAVAAPRSKGEIQRELLDLKRKAHAFRRKGQTEEAEEVLKMAKVLEVQIEELEAPKALPMKLGPGRPENQRIAQGATQSSPAQSGNFADLLTGDDWRGSPGSTEKQYDSLTCSDDSVNASPPIQLRSSQEDLRKRDDAIIHKQDDTVVANDKRDAKEAHLVLGPSQENESAIRQEIMSFKRRASIYYSRKAIQLFIQLRK